MLFYNIDRVFVLLAVRERENSVSDEIFQHVKTHFGSPLGVSLLLYSSEMMFGLNWSTD